MLNIPIKIQIVNVNVNLKPTVDQQIGASFWGDIILWIVSELDVDFASCTPHKPLGGGGSQTVSVYCASRS